MRLLKSLLATLTAVAVFALNTLSASAADIVDTAVEADSFKTLVTAVKAADLVDTLKGEGPYTVFAPTDEAFAALPEGTVESLLQPENKDKLTSILLYHVAPGNVTSDQIQTGPLKSAEGSNLSISVNEGVKVDDANVVQADIEADNGVIHVIDQVLLP